MLDPGEFTMICKGNPQGTVVMCPGGLLTLAEEYESVKESRDGAGPRNSD